MARSLVVLLLVAVVGALGCASDVARHAAPAAGNLHWYRELALENVNVSAGFAATLVDPGGTPWIAFPVVGNATARVYRRAPSGQWELVLERPRVSETSLSSYRAGEVYFGFNALETGYEPNLVRLVEGRVEPMPTPRERLDEKEWLQVGAYAMRSEKDGWACGARGRIWRFDGAAWSQQAPVFAWSPTGPANASYCTSVRFDGDRGWMATLDGQLATFDGKTWTRVDGSGDGGVLAMSPANGLGRRSGELFRWTGSWTKVATRRPFQHDDVQGYPDSVIDDRGEWLMQDGELTSIGSAAAALRGPVPNVVAQIVVHEGELWFNSIDGIYHATRGNEPTFRPARPGAVPLDLTGVVPGDFDDDGDVDLLGVVVESDRDVGDVRVLANDGTGKFAPVAAALPIAVATVARYVYVADLDGDGRLDIAVNNTLSYTLDTFMGRGDCTFARGERLDPQRAWMGAADVDGDGDLDLPSVAVPNDPNVERVYWNDGAGHFTPGAPIALPKGTEKTIWLDVDDDGDLDLIATRWRDPASLLRNDGAAGFVTMPLAFVIEGAIVEDLDRDGRPEVYGQIVHNRGDQPPFTKCVPRRDGCVAEPTEIPAGLAADLNLDGRLDVIQHDLRGDDIFPAEGEVHVANADGSYTRVTHVTGRLAAAAVFDANGDGIPDVYARRGLMLGTNTDAPFLRVRARASAENRFAFGGRVLVRAAGSDAIVASVGIGSSELLIGVPDRSATYDVEVRFPGGRTSVHRGISPWSDVEAHDARGVAWGARMFGLWWRQTARLASLPRDLGVVLAVIGVAAFPVRRLRAQRPPRTVAFGAFTIAYLALAGSALRAHGAWPYLLGPGALGVAAVVTATTMAIARRRSARKLGPYSLIEKLGEGAAATVWRARHAGRTVALKVFSLESMQVSEARDRFFREARAGSEIEHENLVRILDAGRTDDGRGYLAMQLVEGRSLDRVLAEGPMDPARARTIARDVARALGALHSAGIIHRDVKPSNIMIRGDGSAVVTDLGLVRSALFRTVTRHDVAVGTLAYMSPEQCIGPNVDGRSDVWSLGVVLHEMLAGERPFDADHELELVYRIHNTKPRALPDGVPAPMAAIVAKCLAREPSERFESADALARALEEA